MYSGHNPSALRSRDQIVKAMLSLLEKTPYDKISISKLAQQAGVSRQTFYQIFESQEQVLQYKLDSIYEGYQEQLKQRKEYTMHVQVGLYFKIYAENMSFFNALLDNGQVNILLQSSLRYMKILQQNHQLPNKKYTAYSYPFVAGGLLQVLIAWHQQKPKDQVSIEKLIQISEQLLENNYFLEA
ncbi:MAG TPA: TetR/AcrR family transcriptional regulator [Ligilactobacillus acidipiscis]|uniref:TetR/AcrR family transcriptional regulator n=1 Tax=Ligilactobacillus acidipiscis TaxID=89059 RepID=A0A921F9T9_9LACO|nr:TetR/AcrR family transcriptional regulator [Ligilactobacillus acidipiscis]